MDQPAWVQCPMCDNMLCNIHGVHVHDCSCPPIDEWETDPYSEPAVDPEEENR